LSNARVGSGLLVVIPVIFSMIVMLELVLGGGVRWLPNIDAVILAPVLLTVLAKRSEAGRIRSWSISRGWPTAISPSGPGRHDVLSEPDSVRRLAGRHPAAIRLKHVLVGLLREAP
jgi:hypothetical protein